MSKKIVEYLVLLLKKLKKLIPTLHFSEVVSVFNKFYDWFAEQDPDADNILRAVSSFLFFFGGLFLLLFIFIVCSIIGG